MQNDFFYGTVLPFLLPELESTDDPRQLFTKKEAKNISFSDLPVIYDHQYGPEAYDENNEIKPGFSMENAKVIGTIVFQRDGSGAKEVMGSIPVNDNVWGRYAATQLAAGVLRDLSLGHQSSTYTDLVDGMEVVHKVPREISVCTAGYHLGSSIQQVFPSTATLASLTPDDLTEFVSRFAYSSRRDNEDSVEYMERLQGEIENRYKRYQDKYDTWLGSKSAMSNTESAPDAEMTDAPPAAETAASSAAVSPAATSEATAPPANATPPPVANPVPPPAAAAPKAAAKEEELTVPGLNATTANDPTFLREALLKIHQENLAAKTEAETLRKEREAEAKAKADAEAAALAERRAQAEKDAERLFKAFEDAREFSTLSPDLAKEFSETYKAKLKKDPIEALTYIKPTATMTICASKDYKSRMERQATTQMRSASTQQDADLTKFLEHFKRKPNFERNFVAPKRPCIEPSATQVHCANQNQGAPPAKSEPAAKAKSDSWAREIFANASNQQRIATYKDVCLGITNVQCDTYTANAAGLQGSASGFSQTHDREIRFGAKEFAPDVHQSLTEMVATMLTRDIVK